MPNPWFLIGAVILAGGLYWHATCWLDRQPQRNVVDELWDDFHGEDVD